MREVAAAVMPAAGMDQVWLLEDCTASRASLLGVGCALRVVVTRDSTIVLGDDAALTDAAHRATGQWEGTDAWELLAGVHAAAREAQTDHERPAFFHAAFECTHAAEGIAYHPRTEGDAVLAELAIPDAVVEVDPGGNATLTGTDSGAARVIEALSGAKESGPVKARGARPVGASRPPPDYVRAMRECLAHIAVGEAYQVVLGYFFDEAGVADPFELYRALVESDPAPYGFYWPLWEGRTIVGASPECLAHSDGTHVSVRPLAGTARRTGDPATDAAGVEALASDVKELGEHLMLLDLCRDDLAKGCQPGSVRVVEEFAVEEYRNVFHLASQVTGSRPAGRSPWDSIRDVFPAGTMTGAPRLRAMEIINTLEAEPRGPYAGAVGYVRGDGSFDTGICIRMIEVSPGGSRLRAAGGVLAESSPAREWAEIEAKIAGCRAALATGGRS